MINNFLFNFISFCIIVNFLTKLLLLGILFSTAVRAVVVAKLLILGIFHVTTFILALRVALVAKLVISGILSSIFSIIALYTSFLMTSFFTALLSLLKSTGVVITFPISNFYLLHFLNCLNHQE